jgi:AMP nucleosidase
VRIQTDTAARSDSRLSYGFVAGPGTYETTLTRPDLFANYYQEQFRLLIQNHHVALEVGTSRQPIPVHFALDQGDHLEGRLDQDAQMRLRDLFDLPDLAAMDDGIANGTHEPAPGEPAGRLLPASSAALHRHRSGTLPEFRAVYQLPVLCG